MEEENVTMKKTTKQLNHKDRKGKSYSIFIFKGRESILKVLDSVMRF